MSDSQETGLNKVIQKLELAISSIDGCLSFLPSEFNSSRRSSITSLVAQAISKVDDIKYEIYNLDPNLVPVSERPSLEPVDLSNAIAAFEHKNIIVKQGAEIAIVKHLTTPEKSTFTALDSYSKKEQYAKKWWAKQKKPFVPIMRVINQLNHQQIFIRYHAAKAIEKVYNVSIWDIDKREIKIDNLNAWIENNGFDKPF